MAIVAILTSCGDRSASNGAEAPLAVRSYAILRDSLTAIAAEAPGEVGIAVVVDGEDTVTVNNDDKYPLMSVFKLHQAVALCHELEGQGGDDRYRLGH